MKYFLIFTLIGLVACQPKQKIQADMISVSILPQQYFVDQISGGKIKVNVLVPPGSSPHNYSVLPSQMEELAHSKAWLQVGLLTFEEAWKEKFADTNPDLAIINTSEGIQLMDGGEHDHEHEEMGGHSHETTADPHVWLAPEEVKILAKNTLLALQSAFPEQSESLSQNYNQFILKIDSLDAWIKTELAPLQNRNILIFHPTLGYFAREYGITQIPLELEGKEPSPKHMKTIVDQARQQNIRIVFIQKEFDAENALQLSREIGGEVVTIDPLEYNWEKQMRDITIKIASQK